MAAERAVLDELPGVVQKRCRVCGEWWPDDAEFFEQWFDNRRGRTYLRLACLACLSRGAGYAICGPRALGIGHRSCPTCGTPLAPARRPDARYCSHNCGARASQRRLRGWQGNDRRRARPADLRSLAT